MGDLNDLGRRKDFNFEDWVGSNENTELILLNWKVEQYHIFINNVLNVEFHVEIESFRKWPLYAVIDHFYASFPPISYKVAARLLLNSPLLFQKILQQNDWKLKDCRVSFLVIEILDQNRENTFDNLTVDGICMDERNDQFRNLFDLLRFNF